MHCIIISRSPPAIKSAGEFKYGTVMTFDPGCQTGRQSFFSPSNSARNKFSFCQRLQMHHSFWDSRPFIIIIWTMRTLISPKAGFQTTSPVRHTCMLLCRFGFLKLCCYNTCYPKASIQWMRHMFQNTWHTMYAKHWKKKREITKTCYNAFIVNIWYKRKVSKITKLPSYFSAFVRNKFIVRDIPRMMVIDFGHDQA